jgi:hypothetical protein
MPSMQQYIHPHAQFVESRARADRELASQRSRAIRTVAGHARSGDDLAGLLSMLGLDETTV